MFHQPLPLKFPPTDTPTATSPTISNAPATPIQNTVVTLLIGISEAVNGLHTHMSEEILKVQDHMDSAMQKLLERIMESTLTKLQSLVSPPAIATYPLSTFPPSSAARTSLPSGE